MMAVTPFLRTGSTHMQACGDAWNNTCHCVRLLATPQNTTTLTRMCCQFEDDQSFRELHVEPSQ